MKFRLLLLVSLSICFCQTGGASWLEVNSSISDQVPEVTLQSQGTANWRMSIAIPGFVLESFVENGQTFQRIGLPNERMASADGEAPLPLISRVLALRAEGNPELEVLSEEWVELEGTFDLPVDADDGRAMEHAGRYATRDEYLPDVSFGVTPRQVMGGISIAVVYVHPAKYNPAQKKIRVLRSAELRVRESGSTIDYDRPITETTASILRAVVPNWDEVCSNVEVVRGSLLYIVANNSTVQSAIQDLVTWRTRKGYTVEVAGPNEIGTWTTTNIKNYIQGRYNSADPPLEFVCLVGDADGSPSIPAYSYTSGYYTGVGDYGYTQLDGNDLLPDVAIGRLCFNTITELNVILNKTFYYEREPAAPTGGGNPSWYKGGGLFAGDYDDGWNNSGISTVQLMRWTRERMLENGFTSSSIDTVYYIHESVTAYDMNSSINSGISLYSYRGMQFMSDYDSGDLGSLSNGRRLPFMIILTCNTNDYDTDDGQGSICEHLVKTGTIATPKGAIGAIGTSSPGTHVQYNNCICGGIFQGLLREGIRTMAGSLARSKVELYINYPVDSMDVRFFCGISTLIGDPAVDIFTDTPDTLFVNNPGSISVGTNTLTLTVTNEHGQTVADAYVNLVKGTEIFMGDWTNSSGQVTFNFTTTTAESLFVTASKHNCRPAINHTLVTTSTRFVSPASLVFSLDDDNSGESSGNADGLANPGETIELAVSLKNWGTLTAPSVQADLSLSDPFLTGIGDSHENYGDIASGATVPPPDDFDFTIAPYAPDGHILQFTLTVTDALTNTWTSAAPIRISNGNLEYIGCTVLGGDGILDPGDSGQLQLKLINIGTRGTPAGTIGYLRSGNPAITVSDSVGSFVAAAPGQQCDNRYELFEISAVSFAVPGDRIPLAVIFPLSNGFADTISFHLSIGTLSSTTPTPPDSYGYWAFDNTDVGCGKCPTYSWVEIDGRYGGSGTNLNITDNADEADKTAVVSLPFTFKYYGQDFTQISVCSNGWLAMGADQAIHTDFRNWTIPGALGPEAMIAPFWDDLRVANTSSGGRIYTYHDAANHRFIVQWSRVYKYGGSNPTETFQCILYQPGYPATPTGDGEILFQYMTCVNTYDVSYGNDYATVGIENLNESDGTLYSYWNIAAPGAATMTSGRAILFTTQKIPPTTPKSPTNLAAIRSGDDIQLRWNAVREDLFENPITVSQYKVYRDLSPDFTPGGGNYLVTASDTTCLDIGAISGSIYFYVVQAYVAGSLGSGEPAPEAVKQ
ncbi:MAG: C25 family cysteine peptidase [bacterium]